MEADLLSLGQELAEITRLVEDDDVETALGRYVTRVTRSVPGCDHASITVAAKGGAETVAGIDEPFLAYRAGERPDAASPILEAITYREPRRLSDARTDRRWPVFAAQMAHAGYRSAFVLPLATESEPSAAFTLLSRNPAQFADTSYDVVLLFALHAGVVFDNATLYHDSQTLVAHLRAALVNRSTIGQAQGLLMHRNGYDASHAFTALETASQHHNTKLREVARSLVTAHQAQRLDASLDEFGLLQTS